MIYISIENRILTVKSIPFSSASFRARGDAITRSSLVVLLVGGGFSFFGAGVVCCSVLLVDKSSFFVGSFSSEDFGFVDVSLLSPL